MFSSCWKYDLFIPYTMQQVKNATSLDQVRLRKSNLAPTHMLNFDVVVNHVVSFLILYLTSLQLVLCRVAAVKRLPVHQP